jgi:hypothetical protein
VDLELNCGSVIVVLSPRQVEALTHLFQGLASPASSDRSNVVPLHHNMDDNNKSKKKKKKNGCKPMDDADFRRVEQELQAQLYLRTKTTTSTGTRFGGGGGVITSAPRPGNLSLDHGWSSSSCAADEEEDEFLPVTGGGKNNSRRNKWKSPPIVNKMMDTSSIAGSSEMGASVNSKFTARGPISEASVAR